jgi:DNA-binding IclR family transcriptional regulator
MDVPVKSVKKALDLLTALGLEARPGESVGLFELSNKMGMPPNTARSLLKTMIACGYVSQDGDSRYLPGPRCRQLGRLCHLSVERVESRLMPVLRAACESVGESLVLVTLREGARLVLARAEPRRDIHVAPAVLQEGVMFSTPNGRVLTAYAEESEKAQILEKEGWPKDQWDGIKNISELDASLARIRGRGGEIMRPSAELIALACPVLGSGGSLLGALGCFAPLFRCPPERAEDILRQLKEHAVSLALNW